MEYECFGDTQQAAEFIVASLMQGWDAGVPIQSVTSASTAPPPDNNPKGKFYHPAAEPIALNP